MIVYKGVAVYKDKLYSCKTFNSTSKGLLEQNLPLPGNVLEYEIDKETKPQFGCIFAFETLDAALYFRRLFCIGGEKVPDVEYAIIQGVGKESKRQYYSIVSCIMNSILMKKFWKGTRKRKNELSLPDRTVFLKSFKFKSFMVTKD